jgi:hypothetical protein
MRTVLIFTLTAAAMGGVVGVAQAHASTDWQTQVVRCTRLHHIEYYTSAGAAPAIQRAMTATFYQGYNIGRWNEIRSVTVLRGGTVLARVMEAC